MPAQQGIMSSYQLTAHDHSGVGQGGLVPLASITGHNKAVHDALLINADLCDGQHLETTTELVLQKLTIDQPGGGSNLVLISDVGNIPVILFKEGVNNRATLQYDSGLDRFYIQPLSENSDIHLVPEGTGKVRFGARVAKGAETLTGYILIKDSGGASRKVGIIS